MAEQSKQHTINFSKGICNLTPDIICDDNELQDCTNLTFNDSAIRPVQGYPASIESSKAQLIKVHDLAVQNNFIYYGSSTIPPSKTSEEITEDIVNPIVKKDVAIYIWKDDSNTLYGRLNEAVRGSLEINVNIKYLAKTDGNFTDDERYGTVKQMLGGDKTDFQMKATRHFVLISAEIAGAYTGNDVSNFVFRVGEVPSTNSKPLLPSGPTQSDGGEAYYEAVFFNKKGDSPDTLIHIASFDSHVTGAEIIGNTLIVNTEQGLRYFLWDADRYKDLGERIPDFQINFSLYNHIVNAGGSFVGRGVYEESSSINASGFLEDDGTGGYKVKADQDTAARDAFVGLYAENKNKIHKKKLFCLPFFAVAAVKLYDGTHILSSAPVLLFPTVNNNSYFSIAKNNADENHPIVANLTTFCSRLRYELKADYSDWKDLVKEVSVFVSYGVEVYDTEVLKFNSNNPTNSVSPYLLQGETSRTPFAILSDKSIIGKLETTRTFYEIANLGITSSAGYVDDFVKDGVISTLVNQPTLSMDYFTHCPISAGFMASYNRRLNIANVKRGFFEGFKQFTSIQSDDGTLFTHHISVTIKTPYGDIEVSTSYDSRDMSYDDMWFYYPDPRAKYATIDGQTVELKEHPGLNGAYYIGEHLPSSNMQVLTGGAPAESSKFFEPLTNYLLQSEVDNPWVFLSSGYVRVGQGQVKGMAALTTALSQDAYKVATTLAFTTQGIWALQANGEGQYASVTPPFSREVCNNPDSITMVDHGVFFTSEKGLMLILDNDIKCVSDQLRGKHGADYEDFCKFIRTCECAYDYQAQHLLLINRNINYGYHWLYNIRSGTFTRIINNTKYISIVPDYPDTLLQDRDYNIYSMISKPNINEDPLTYSGTLVTRPMKLDGSLILDTLDELKHITTIPREKITTTIEASNDCIEWHEIPSLHGAPYKFHRLRISLTDISATDTFCGTILLTQPRHTDKLR